MIMLRVLCVSAVEIDFRNLAINIWASSHRRNNMKQATVIGIIFLLAGALLVQTGFAQSGGNQGSRGYGVYNAANYNYGGNFSIPALKVTVGNSATGSQTYTLASGAVSLPDGRVIFPLSTSAPITIDVGANAETVTPSRSKERRVGKECRSRW